MKIIFLLFCITMSFKSFFVFSDENKVLEDSVKTEWGHRLTNKTNWKLRLNAVKNWKIGIEPNNPNSENLFLLSLRLADKSQKVRKATVTAFEEMAKEEKYKDLKFTVMRALAKRRPRDTDNLFLRKIKIVTEIFKRNKLSNGYNSLQGYYYILPNIENSGLDKVFVFLYEMAGTGMSNEQNIELQRAAIQLLDAIMESLTEELNKAVYGTFVESQFFDCLLKGLQIIATGLTDKNPEVRTAIIDLLRKTLGQSKNLFDFGWKVASEIIPLIAKKGFSHSDYKIRKNIINLFLDIVEFYPYLNSEIEAILKERLKKEKSHHMKIFIKKSLRKLQNSKCKKSLNDIK